MSTDPPELEPGSDEAWKEQVRAENAELDRKAAGAPDGPSKAGDESATIPPAEFATLVEMFTTQALVAMGMIPHPGSGKPEVQLPLARHFIGLLGIVETKTAGNLSGDETSLLGGSLHYLRMSYIEISKRAGTPKT